MLYFSAPPGSDMLRLQPPLQPDRGGLLGRGRAALDALLARDAVRVPAVAWAAAGPGLHRVHALHALQGCGEWVRVWVWMWIGDVFRFCKYWALRTRCVQETNEFVDASSVDRIVEITSRETCNVRRTQMLVVDNGIEGDERRLGGREGSKRGFSSPVPRRCLALVIDDRWRYLTGTTVLRVLGRSGVCSVLERSPADSITLRSSRSLRLRESG